MKYLKKSTAIEKNCFLTTVIDSKSDSILISHKEFSPTNKIKQFNESDKRKLILQEH